MDNTKNIMESYNEWLTLSDTDKLLLISETRGDCYISLSKIKRYKQRKIKRVLKTQKDMIKRLDKTVNYGLYQPVVPKTFPGLGMRFKDK